MNIILKMLMRLFPTLQTIKKYSLILIIVWVQTACHQVLKEDDHTVQGTNLSDPVLGYTAKLYFSSIFGAMDLDIKTDLIEQVIDITLKDTLEGTPKSLLRYKNNRWAFKDPNSNEDYYYISDKNFLKYLYLDRVLPHSAFIVNLLQGTFPYQNKVPKEGQVTLEIKGKDYFQNIHVDNGKPYLIDILDSEKNSMASIEYGSNYIRAENFYLPLFLTINYAKHNLTFSLSISEFKTK